MFKLFLSGEETMHFSFESAFRKMFEWVQYKLSKRELSYQILETFIWIEDPSGKVFPFYDARDMAYDLGIMKDRKLV